MDFNIMATLDSEEENVENFEQCTETITQSEPETECSQLINHPSQHTHHTKNESMKNPRMKLYGK